MRVRTDYVNPLAMMDKRQSGQGAASPVGKRNSSVEDLQNKRQQLQNQMLLLKASGTDSVGGSEELQKELETALEEVTANLRSAKTEAVQTTQGAEECAAAKHPLNRDRYEPGDSESESFGFYHLENDEETGCRMVFEPYREK